MLACGQSSFLKPGWHAPTGAHCGTVVPACARMQQQKPRSTWPSDQGVWSLAGRSAHGARCHWHHPDDPTQPRPESVDVLDGHMGEAHA